MIKSIDYYDHATRSYLTIMAEALNLIPPDVKARHPDIPWATIKGLRNRIVHAYWRIDLDIIQRIARDDAPRLVAALDRVIVAEQAGAS